LTNEKLEDSDGNVEHRLALGELGAGDDVDEDFAQACLTGLQLSRFFFVVC